MHMAKRHRINHRLSTSDTILFVVVYERRRGRGSDFTHNFNYEMENELPQI